MSNDDITHEILLSIRDEIRGTNQRIDGTNQRIDRLDSRVDALGRVVRENDIRVRTELVEVSGLIKDVSLVLRHNLELRDRVTAVEHDVAELKQRRH